MLAPIKGAAALGLVGAMLGFCLGAKVVENHWSAKYNQLVAQHATALQQATDQAREREHALQDQIQEVVSNAKKKQDKLAADNRELSARIKRLLQTANDNPTLAEDSCVADGGKTAQAAIDLRAELFGEVVRVSQQLAEEADRRGVAGEACEAAYTKIEKPSV